jgi:hypothetical protein
MSVPPSYNVARQTGLGHPFVHRTAEREPVAFILWK